MNQAHTGTTPPEREAALRVLLDQIQGAIVFVEDVLDHDHPGWDQPTGRGRRRLPGGETAPRYAYGLLSTAWINLATLLLNEPGVQAWSIPPLLTRDLEEAGHMTRWEFGPDGHANITSEHLVRLDLSRIPQGAVRVAHDPEPRYTLTEAARILSQHTEHRWEVITGPTGEPLTIRCTHRGCGEARDVGEASPVS